MIVATPSQPILVPYRKNLNYMITHDDIMYSVSKTKNVRKATFIVPRGFVTDGATIPYGLRWVVGQPFWPKFQVATLLHDYLYVTQLSTKKEADYMFLTLLRQNGVGKIRRQAMFLAVHVFGARIWNRRKKAKEAKISGQKKNKL